MLVLQTPYAVPTRRKRASARSIAAIVFSKVGGAGLLAMRSISARFSAIAARAPA
jgi:hypothetical protein